jgi:UDP-N-acetylmuramate dehydrogenase
MRLGGNAQFLTDIADEKEIPEAVAWAEEQNVPLIMIGGGSNIIWGDKGFPGLVLVNKIMGFETEAQDTDSAYVTIGAGEHWDSVVERCVKMGLSGIEHLSLIPGSAGATPIQNVGAYGKEIADSLVTLQAYDTKEKRFVTLPKSECGFGYRTSRFKTTDKGRYLIINITLFLTKTNPTPPFYASLQNYFEQHSITTYTPQVVRDAVIEIRNSKLPDPAIVANNGSFFANPLIAKSEFTSVHAKFPELKYWEQDDGSVKLSAGWLVEAAGFKGVHDEETGMATWDKQALVLVNEKAEHTADLLKFKAKIVDKVAAMFGITLEQEPELID